MFHLNTALTHSIFNAELYSTDIPLSTGKKNTPFSLKIIFGVRSQGDVDQPKLSLYEITLRKRAALWVPGT